MPIPVKDKIYNEMRNIPFFGAALVTISEVALAEISPCVAVSTKFSVAP